MCIHVLQDLYLNYCATDSSTLILILSVLCVCMSIVHVLPDLYLTHLGSYTEAHRQAVCDQSPVMLLMPDPKPISLSMAPAMKGVAH